MDVDELAGNRYVIAAVAVVAVLLTGLLVQGSGAASASSPQAEKAVYDAGTTRSLAADSGAGGGAVEQAAETGGQDRMRVTRVSMDIDVPDVQQAQTEIESLADRYSGFVEDTSLSREYGDRGRMEVRVPEANRTQFTAAIEERWTVESRDTSVEDVTRRHTELSLELKNKRQELRQLEKLMNRSDDVENLIRIQERMGELRTRIQYLENEMAELEERVEYATVTMEEASAFETRFELRRAATDAYRGAFKSVNLMIVGTGYLLPFAALFAVLYLVKRRWDAR
ncbi:MAG: DUF4349 domain-containing protein [Candidatus Nanohaloarchaea archaeon]